MSNQLDQDQPRWEQDKAMTATETMVFTSNKSQLRTDIEHAINRNSAENGSDTPDFILAEYLMLCLDAFDKTLHARSNWYNHHCRIGNCNHLEEKTDCISPDHNVDANHAETKAPCDDCGKPTYNLHSASGIRLCEDCTTRQKEAKL